MKSQRSQHNPITLVWENLTVKTKDKTILNHISGYCNPGQILAIMGPSGAGKTTLLSLLASKRSKQLQIQGQVFANNQRFSAKDFYNFGVYIFQNDVLHQNLTVKQTLEFITRLKIKDKNQVQTRVKQMIYAFELQKCQDTYIGGKFKKGISGGQKKRACIAVQMITDPQLLILDQPTSGLDSNKVKAIIKVIKRLATQKNKTIIFTLHQPSFLVYKELDRLILLNKGQIVYQGRSSQMYSYMQKSLKITIPLNCTISDFFMMEISQYKKVKNNQYKTPLNKENYCLYLEKQQKQQFNQAKLNALDDFTVISTSKRLDQEFFILMSREWTVFTRNPMKGLRTLFTSLLVVVSAGLIFRDGIIDRRPENLHFYPFQYLQMYFIQAQGVTYFAVLSCIMIALKTVDLTFPMDKQIYYKQTSSKKYRPISYLFSKIIIQTFSCIFGVLIFGTGEYFFVGYHGDAVQFIKFMLVLFLCSLVGNSLGFFIGSLFKDASRASAMTPIVLMPLTMFSGIFNRLDSMYVWISWIQYLSPFKYALHTILLNEFGDQMYMTEKGYFDYKKEISINIQYQWNIVILVGLTVLFYGLSFVMLKQLSLNLAP